MKSDRDKVPIRIDATVEKNFVLIFIEKFFSHFGHLINITFNTVSKL